MREKKKSDHLAKASLSDRLRLSDSAAYRTI